MYFSIPALKAVSKSGVPPLCALRQPYSVLQPAISANSMEVARLEKIIQFPIVQSVTKQAPSALLFLFARGVQLQRCALPT